MQKIQFKNKHKSLLILDLDETLIHARETPLEHKADFKVFQYNVYIRPGLIPFLEQLAKQYLLAIWSSASDDYVEAVVKQILPKNISLEFCWGRSRCTYKYNSGNDGLRYINSYELSYYYATKPLKKVRRLGYSLDRILIVDNSPYKVQANYGNAIYIKSFEGEASDEELQLLAKYLDTLKNQNKVRTIEKRNWRAIVMRI